MPTRDVPMLFCPPTRKRKTGSKHSVNKRTCGGEQTLYPAALTETLAVWLREWAPDKEWTEGGWCAAIEQKLADHSIVVDLDDTESDTSPATFSVDGEYRSQAWVAQRLLGNPFRQMPRVNEGPDSP